MKIHEYSKACVDSRHRPRCRILMNTAKHCSCMSGVQLVPPPGELLNITVLDFGPLGPWYENMTSFIKPEVQNVSQRRQRSIKPLPQTTCIKIW